MIFKKSQVIHGSRSDRILVSVFRVVKTKALGHSASNWNEYWKSFNAVWALQLKTKSVSSLWPWPSVHGTNAGGYGSLVRNHWLWDAHSFVYDRADDQTPKTLGRPSRSFLSNSAFSSKKEIRIIGTVKLPQIWIIRYSWQSSRSTTVSFRTGRWMCRLHLPLTRGPMPERPQLCYKQGFTAVGKISALLARMCAWVLAYYCPLIFHSALCLATSKLSQWQVRREAEMSACSL